MAESLNTILTDFEGQFETDAGKDYAEGVSKIVQEHAIPLKIADVNAMEGEQFVLNLDNFKQSMVDMARRDPRTMDMAFDLIPHTVNSILSQHPDPEMVKQHGQPIIDHMRQEVARAGIQAFAYENEDAAHAALNRYDNYLTIDDKRQLAGFASTMEIARQQDHQTQIMVAAKKQQETNDQLSTAYLNALKDPPPDWARKMLADNRVNPQTSAALWQAYEAFQKNGNVDTDGNAVADYITRWGQGQAGRFDLMAMVGSKISLEDAGTLLGTIDKAPKFMQTLAVHMDAARRYLAPDNDLAGIAAYGRFAKWFVNEVGAGPMDLDPKSERYFFGETARAIFNQFRATGDDFNNQMLPLWHHDRTEAGERMPLREIFGKNLIPPAIPRRGVELPVPMGSTPSNPNLQDKKGNPAEPNYTLKEIKS